MRKSFFLLIVTLFDFTETRPKQPNFIFQDFQINSQRTDSIGSSSFIYIYINMIMSSHTIFQSKIEHVANLCMHSHVTYVKTWPNYFHEAKTFWLNYVKCIHMMDLSLFFLEINQRLYLKWLWINLFEFWFDSPFNAMISSYIISLVFNLNNIERKHVAFPFENLSQSQNIYQEHKSIQRNFYFKIEKFSNDNKNMMRANRKSI